MEQKIKEIIKQKHEVSKGTFGTYVVTLQNTLNLTFAEIKPILSKLHKERYFIARKGINGALLFFNVFSGN